MFFIFWMKSKIFVESAVVFNFEVGSIRSFVIYAFANLRLFVSMCSRMMFFKFETNPSFEETDSGTFISKVSLLPFQSWFIFRATRTVPDQVLVTVIFFPSTVSRSKRGVNLFLSADIIPDFLSWEIECYRNCLWIFTAASLLLTLLLAGVVTSAWKLSNESFNASFLAKSSES